MKILYYSDDGHCFETAEACLAHENSSEQKLKRLIAKYITTNYNVDADCDIIEESDVHLFITSYWDEIKQIMEQE